MKKIILILSLFVFVADVKAWPPVLVWEKELKFKIFDYSIASITGEVIVTSKEARRILLYDKKGDLRFEWGPRKDRQPFEVAIADDGSVFAFMTGWTEDYVFEKNIDTDKENNPWNHKIHYYDKNGKELWSKEIMGNVGLSSDGKLIGAYATAGAGGDGVILFDNLGNKLWEYDNAYSSDSSIQFSPENNYILISDAGRNESSTFLYDKKKNVIWSVQGSREANSVSENGEYIFLLPLQDEEKGKLYNTKTKELILEDNGFTDDKGTKVVIIHSDKVSILNLPDKTSVMEYSLKNVVYGLFSSDGNYLLLTGARSDINSDNNIFLFDIPNKKVSEGKVEGDEFAISNDCSFIVTATEDKIRYYKIK